MVSHQVVKVVVLNCEPSKERMLLSFRLLSDPKQECEGQSQKKKKAVSAGQVPDFSRQIGLVTEAENRVPLTLGPGTPGGEAQRSCLQCWACVRAQGSGQERKMLLPSSLSSVCCCPSPLWALGPACKSVFHLGPIGGTWERRDVGSRWVLLCVRCACLPGLWEHGVGMGESCFSDLDFSVIPGAGI